MTRAEETTASGAGPDTRDVDIAIIGGGMVGLSLALLLSVQNPQWKVLVVEAFNVAANADEASPPRYRPSFDGRSTALSHSTCELFQQLGLWQALSEHVEAIQHVHVSDKGHIGSTRMSAEEQQLPSLGCVIENQWLGAVLMAAVQKQSRIELVAPARLDQVKFHQQGAAFSLADVSTHFNAKLFVIADGAQSETRKKLGIGTKVKDYNKVALIANISLEKPHLGVAFERFTDHGPMAMLPLSDLAGEHRSALVWTMSPERGSELQSAADDHFLAELQSHFGHRLGKFRRVGERFSYPLQQIKANEQVRRNLVVIGNAAHSLHPVAGQGFNLSLRDAAMLADVLSEAGRRGQCVGELSVLETYLQRQQMDQQQTMLLSDILPAVFGMKSAPIALARNIGLLALDAVPAFRHQFSRLGMGMETRGVKLRG